MSTPLLSTYVKSRSVEREQQMQTAFPAKVLEWNSALGVVKLEPQFVETWVTQDGRRLHETLERPEYAYIENVPVCFPHFMSWDIPVDGFGLVICTKYSLDKWRNQLQRVDPGDLRRFTMSGATFHPVVIGRSPSVAQDWVALDSLVRAELVKIQTTLGSVVDATFGETYTAPTSSGDLGSSKVKVEV